MYFTNVYLLNEEKKKEKFQIVKYKLTNERENNQNCEIESTAKNNNNKNNYTIRIQSSVKQCNLARPKSQNSDKKVKVYET